MQEEGLIVYCRRGFDSSAQAIRSKVIGTQWRREQLEEKQEGQEPSGHGGEPHGLVPGWAEMQRRKPPVLLRMSLPQPERKAERPNGISKSQQPPRTTRSPVLDD
jgi:hypothetical protein